MADTVSKHIDMTTGSLWRNIPLFAFPVAATEAFRESMSPAIGMLAT